MQNNTPARPNAQPRPVQKKATNISGKTDSNNESWESYLQREKWCYDRSNIVDGSNNYFGAFNRLYSSGFNSLYFSSKALHSGTS